MSILAKILGPQLFTFALDMKTLVNSWFWVAALCATLGLAPFFPEPHFWGKLRWIEGGAIGMKLLDWWDFILHGAPWALLGRLIFFGALSFFEKFFKTKYLNP